MRHLAAIAALGFITLLIGPVQGQDGIAEWTYMQYFAMDNNLEVNLYNDLTELQGAGSTDQVNLVAQVDRIPGFQSGFGDWTDTRRFLLRREDQPVLTSEQKLEDLLMIAYADPARTPEDLRAILQQLRDTDPAAYRQLVLDLGLDPDNAAQIDAIAYANNVGVTFNTPELEGLGEVDMGEAASLAEFATWAVANFPAQRYALTISTHGGGWAGNGPDDTDDHDMLRIPELTAALDQILAETGIGQFDLIGFDACLMGQLEVYAALAPYTKYVLAAEEIIPGNGWEYTTPFSQLAENPTMSAGELGQSIIDAYVAYYDGPGDRTKVDLHLVDTSQIPAVLNALDAFTAVATPDLLDKLSALGVARTNAQSFGGDAGDVLAGQGGAALYNSVDLVSLMTLIASQTDLDPAVTSAAWSVVDAARSAVVYGGADSFLPDAHGMAIYFPTNANAMAAFTADMDLSYSETVPEMAVWGDFLGQFHDTVATGLLPENLSIEITQLLPEGAAASIYDPPVAIFDTAGEGIANLAFNAVLNQPDGTRIMVDFSPLVFESELPDGRTVRTFPSGESSGMTFQWNAEMLMLNDGQTQIPSLLLINQPGVPQGVIGGTYVSQADGQQVQASLVVDLAEQKALSTYGINDQGAPYEIRPQPGDQFVPNWYALADDGTVQTSPADAALVYGVNPFRYAFVPALSGDYTLTMLVQDLAGNTAISTTDVTVDNSDLDPTLRGFKDLDYGINFLYPWGWSDPVQLTDEEGNITSIALDSPDGAATIYVTRYDGDLETTVQNVLDTLGSLPDAIVDEPQPIPDAPAYWITYSYSADDGSPRSGGLIVAFAEASGASFSFDLDAPAADADQYFAVIEQLYNSLSFFTPVN